MVLALSASDMERLLDYQDAIEAVEDSFRELGAKRVVMPPRSVMEVAAEDGWTSAMSAYLPGKNQLGVKVISAFRNNPKKYNLPTITGEVILLDARTGIPLAIMEAGHITAVRTAATSAVATKYLARQNATSVGIFGSGVQAESHLLALKTVLDLDRAFVFDIAQIKCAEFCTRMTRKLGLRVTPMDPKGVAEADVVVTATTSVVPVFDGRWLRRGTHVNGIGSHRSNERELDTVTVCGSKLVVDSRQSAMQEAGDILIPISEGRLAQEAIHAELNEVVLHEKPGRVDDEEITVFKSVGLATEDIAVATAAYKRALESGVGREI